MQKVRDAIRGRPACTGSGRTGYGVKLGFRSLWLWDPVSGAEDGEGGKPPEEPLSIIQKF